MDVFARWLVRHPLLILIVNLLITAALSVYALQIHVESSIDSLLAADDVEVRYYDSARAVRQR